MASIYGQENQEWSQLFLEQAEQYYLVPHHWFKEIHDSMTREETATLSILLYKALGGELSDQKVKKIFKDTNSEEVALAYQLDMIKGKTPHIFSPMEKITREEIIMILYRMMKKLGYSIESTKDYLSYFNDQDQVSSWALQAMNDFISVGLIQGKSGKKLFPQGFIEKEEAIVLALRVYEYMKYIPRYNQQDQNIVIQGISMGTSIKKVKEKLGDPKRIVQSEYGFEWYIYHHDYQKYLQVGIKNDQVVALYTNDPNWKSKNGIIMGDSKDKVKKIYPSPATSIEKGYETYEFLPMDGVDRYKEEDYYLYFFYDLLENSKLTGVLLIHQTATRELEGYLGQLSEEVRQGYEKVLFDLTNAERVKAKKEPLQWDEKAAKVAYNHSIDMAENHFFSHHGYNKSTLEKRFKKASIPYEKLGENIAMNLNSILTHHQWMNSTGHRENILGDYQYIGIGTAFHDHEEPYAIYHTQNFYK